MKKKTVRLEVVVEGLIDVNVGDCHVGSIQIDGGKPGKNERVVNSTDAMICLISDLASELGAKMVEVRKGNDD